MEWQEGMEIRWENLAGGKFEGTIVEVDNGTLIVDCTDGVRRAVNG